jgi:hypothetical protein
MNISSWWALQYRFLLFEAISYLWKLKRVSFLIFRLNRTTKVHCMSQAATSDRRPFTLRGLKLVTGWKLSLEQMEFTSIGEPAEQIFFQAEVDERRTIADS